MKEPLKILLLDDNTDDAEIIQRFLVKKKLFFKFSLAIDQETYLLALDQFHPDIILSDHSLPQFNSVDALAIARQRFPGIPFIIVTGTASEEFAADIMKSGADDYILKDRLTRLPAAINTVLRLRQTEKEKLKSAEELRRSEENYRTLVDQAFDSIIIYTPNLIILDCNHRACSTLGYTREELKKQNVNGLFFKEDILARPLRFETLKAGQRTLDYRRVKRKDGTGIEMEIGTKIMPDGNLMAIARDITERKKTEQKIIQSETNLRAIFENTSEGFLLMDKNAVVIAFNSKATAYTFFSNSKEFKVGQSIYDFIEESRKEFIQRIITRVLNGESMFFDRSYEMKKGATVWIDFSASPVMDAGQVNGICITGRDITEKKIVEQEREFDRNNLKALINNTNDPMWSVDRSLRLITSNEAFEKIVKAMSGRIVAKGSDILANGFSKVQLDLFRKYYERAFSGENFTVIEYAALPDDFWSEISFYPIHDGDTIVGAACFSRDITQRKKAEEALRESEIRLNEAQALAHIGNWEVDLVRNIHTWSDEFYRIYGLRKGEENPSTELFLSLMHPGDASFAQEMVQEAFFSLKNSSLNFRFIRKDGIARHGYTEWRFEFDKKRNPIRLFGILQDITERKEAEENLKLLEKKILGQKIEEQKKIARAIMKAQEKERNHIGLELHDNINQILAGIKLHLEMAGKDKKLKELIKYPIELLDSTIHEIRLLSSKLVTPLKNINLKGLIQQLLVDLRKNTKIKISFAYNLSGLLISDDLKLNIYRTIQEQLNNITKHAAARNVNISVQAHNNIISIVVADDGKGFDVNKKRKGIGISNMMNRIESFNGEVSIESSPGKGCRIMIKVPYKKVHLDHKLA